MAGNKQFSSSIQAFTLVEVSVVLVIIGLIVGGVVLGRDLIHQAQIRTVISQISRYNTATNGFRTKYNELPGDTARAVPFGLADPACPSGVGPIPPVVPGCNGNSDNIINGDSDGDGQMDSDTTNTENINYWYHLAKVGMIDGSYDGLTVIYGVGAPRTKLREKTGFYVGTSNLFPGYNMFIMGLDDANDGQYHMMPLEAWSVDNRMDDGLPDSGIVQVPASMTPPGFEGSCYSVPPNSEYLVDSELMVCALFIRAGF